MKEPLRLLALEHELAGPGRREALARHDAVLLALENRIAGAVREGVPPDRYADLSLLREANATARKILRLTVRGNGAAAAPDAPPDFSFNKHEQP